MDWFSSTGFIRGGASLHGGLEGGWEAAEAEGKAEAVAAAAWEKSNGEGVMVGSEVVVVSRMAVVGEEEEAE